MKTEFNLRTKSPEIIEAFADQLNTKEPVIYCIVDTVNPLYKTIGVMQKVDRPGEVTATDRFLLGWGEQYVRAFRNARADLVKAHGFTVGQPLISEDLKKQGIKADIEVIEDFEPRKMGVDANGEDRLSNPKQAPFNGELVDLYAKDEHGIARKIYRHTTVKINEPAKREFIQNLPVGYTPEQETADTKDARNVVSKETAKTIFGG